WAQIPYGEAPEARCERQLGRDLACAFRVAGSREEDHRWPLWQASGFLRGYVMAVYYHLGAFPPTELDWPQLIPLLGPASAAVARYDGTLAAIPNAAVLLSPLTTQEAVLSSRIEGTQATMGEVLEFEAEGGAPELSEARRNDI